MNKTFLVMKHEFWRHFTRRGFLFAILALPLLIFAIMAGVVWFFTSRADKPVGVVDQAGILLEPAAYAALDEGSTPFILYESETAVHQSLLDNDIQAYFVLPADYLENGRVTMYHNGDAFDEGGGAIADYLRASLLSSSDPLLLERFYDNSLDIQFHSLSDAGEQKSEWGFVISLIVGFIFLIAVFVTSGNLLQAIVDEKENRTMEILITSLKPRQLMTGKVLGLVGLGFVQIGVWTILAALGLMIVRANVPNFPSLAIDSKTVFFAVAWFVPYYVMVASLIASVGVSITAVAEGQYIVGVINILSLFPMYFAGIVIESPHSPFTLALSLIPFSSPLVTLMRTQVATIPIWQLILSWLILVGTAVFTLYLASRLLEFGMLRYGKKVTLGEVRRYLRGSQA